MTVKELISILKTYPSDTEVEVYNHQGEWSDPPELEDWFYDEKKNLLILS